MSVTHYICRRAWIPTADTVNDAAFLQNSTGAAWEEARSLWLVMKTCHCSEEVRRTPSILGVLDYEDVVEVPLRVVVPSTGGWFGMTAARDRQQAPRLTRCRGCKKENWKSLPYYEDYVEHWCRNLIWYEQFKVPTSALQESVFKMISVEAGDSAHYELRALTLDEHMLYLGYTDYTPVEENT